MRRPPEGAFAETGCEQHWTRVVKRQQRMNEEVLPKLLEYENVRCERLSVSRTAFSKASVKLTRLAQRFLSDETLAWISLSHAILTRLVSHHRQSQIMRRMLRKLERETACAAFVQPIDLHLIRFVAKVLSSRLDLLS